MRTEGHWSSLRCRRLNPAVLPNAQALVQSFRNWLDHPTKSPFGFILGASESLTPWRRCPVPDRLFHVLWILRLGDAGTSDAWPTACQARRCRRNRFCNRQAQTRIPSKRPKEAESEKLKASSAYSTVETGISAFGPAGKGYWRVSSENRGVRRIVSRCR